jgi:hypothetical protein
MTITLGTLWDVAVVSAVATAACMVACAVTKAVITLFVNVIGRIGR